MAEIEDFLAHYGVLGMKWGVRKDDRGPSKSQLIKEDRKVAKVELKDRDREYKAARKALRSAKGKEAKAAARKDLEKADDAWYDTYVRSTKQTTGETITEIAIPLAIGSGMIFAGNFIARNPTALKDFASSVKAKRGAQAAAKIFADSKGLTSYKTVGMAFDAVTGRYRMA